MQKKKENLRVYRMQQDSNLRGILIPPDFRSGALSRTRPHIRKTLNLFLQGLKVQEDSKALKSFLRF